MKRFACFLLLGSILVAELRGQGSDRLLPSRTEVTTRKGSDGTILYTLRGRDARASEVLTLMVDVGDIEVIVDALAEKLLRTTIVTVDLFERKANYVVELIAAAAGVDAIQDPGIFRLIGPPMPGSGEVRGSQRVVAERLYNVALLSQRDARVTAIALRGLAELYRRSGDFSSAFAAYETLLARFPRSEPARDTEILLADCYKEVGDPVRATRLLRSFLSKELDPAVRDAGLRRLLTLLIESESYRDIEDLRDGFLKLETISPNTLGRLAEAAMAMIERGDPESAVLLLNELYCRDPEQHAVLGPVLALGMIIQKQPDAAAASRILSLSTAHLTQGAESSTALMALAEVARTVDRGPEALLFATSAMRNDGASPAVQLRANLLLGELYRDLGLTLRARRHFFEAEQLSDEQAAAALALRSAEMAIEEGEPERARLLYQATSDIEIARHEAEMGIARALLEAGDPKRARTVLIRLVRDGYPQRHRERMLHLAVDCLEDLGEYASARQLLSGDLGSLDERAGSNRGGGR